jgi:cysteine-S-conjugate beta-lyase
MHKMNFDQIIDRKGTGCFKYDALQMMYQRDDLIPLWVADMDFAVSEAIQQALAKRLLHPIFGYNLRDKQFNEAIRHWQRSQYNWETSAYKIIPTPSLMTALAISILSLSQAGDEILIQTPVYTPFHTTVKDHERQLLTNPLINVNGKYEINWMDFEDKAKRAKMFILCNPHNPVGKVFSEAELQRMSDICVQNGVIIFSDEIHADLVYPPLKHTPIASINSKLVISGISPAKSFNLAGLATAVMIIKDDDLAQKVNELNQSMHTFMGNSFGIHALIAAYTESADWLVALKEYLKSNRDMVSEYVSEHLPRVRMSPCEATYLAWLDFRDYDLTDEQLMELLRDKAGLALTAGIIFGSEGSGFMRLNFACPRSVLDQALPRIKAAFEALS